MSETLPPDAFFAGLIAGEGSFSITPNNAGASWICSFSLTMRADDTPLLTAAVRWSRAGRLLSCPARANSRPQASWRVASMDDCARLVYALSELPLLGKKDGDFRLWRRAVRTWTDGVGSRWPALEIQARRLRSHRNFNRACDYAGVDITPSYLRAFLSGFATAEGHFGASRPGTPYFTINLRADDAALVHLLQRRVGLGHVASIPARASSRPGISWRVGRRDELRRLVETFDACPPRGRAGRVYRAWRELVLPANHGRERRHALAADVRRARNYRHVADQVERRDRHEERRARCREALRAWAAGETTAHTAMAYERWRLEHRGRTPSRNTVAVAFGSWRDALHAAGIGLSDGLCEGTPAEER